jgi:hypothetical protein
MREAEIVPLENQRFFKTTNYFGNTVAEHRNNLAGGIQYRLKGKCNNFVAVHATAIIASTDVKSNTQLTFFEALMRNFN